MAKAKKKSGAGKKPKNKPSVAAKQSGQNALSGDILISTAVSRYPEIVPVLMQYGIHCIGCHVSAYESLYDGLAGHGFSDDNIQRVISELNKVIAEQNEKRKTIKVNVKDGIKLTKSAVEKIKEAFSKKEGSAKFLRIRVLQGGYSGFSYWLGLEETAQDYDVKIKSEGISLLIDPESYSQLDGTVIDYVQNESEQGFKFNNPKESSS